MIESPRLSCDFQQVFCSSELMFQCREVKNLITVFLTFNPDKNMPMNKIYCGF